MATTKYLHRLVEDTRSRLQDVFIKADGKLADELQLSKLVPILLDLSKYDDEDLVQGSIQLLNKLYSSDINLFKRAVQAQILTEKSRSIHETISKLQWSLRKYLDHRVNIISDSTDDSDSEEAKSVETGSSPLKKLTDKCWLDGEAEGFEPHQQNQKIIFNFGKCN